MVFNRLPASRHYRLHFEHFEIKTRIIFKLSSLVDNLVDRNCYLYVVGTCIVFIYKRRRRYRPRVVICATHTWVRSIYHYIIYYYYHYYYFLLFVILSAIAYDVCMYNIMLLVSSVREWWAPNTISICILKRYCTRAQYYSGALAARGSQNGGQSSTITGPGWPVSDCRS